MLPSSSQAKHWLFNGETDLARHRSEANNKYVSKHRGRKTVPLQFFLISKFVEQGFSLSMKVVLYYASSYKKPKIVPLLNTETFFHKKAWPPQSPDLKSTDKAVLSLL